MVIFNPQTDMLILLRTYVRLDVGVNSSLVVKINEDYNHVFTKQNQIIVLN